MYPTPNQDTIEKVVAEACKHGGNYVRTGIGVETLETFEACWQGLPLPRETFFRVVRPGRPDDSLDDRVGEILFGYNLFAWATLFPVYADNPQA